MFCYRGLNCTAVGVRMFVSRPETRLSPPLSPGAGEPWHEHSAVADKLRVLPAPACARRPHERPLSASGISLGMKPPRRDAIPSMGPSVFCRSLPGQGATGAELLCALPCLGQPPTDPPQDAPHPHPLGPQRCLLGTETVAGCPVLTLAFTGKGFFPSHACVGEVFPCFS